MVVETPWNPKYVLYLCTQTLIIQKLTILILNVSCFDTRVHKMNELVGREKLGVNFQITLFWTDFESQFYGNIGYILIE